MSMSSITGKQVDEVISLFQTNSSIVETARITGLSTVKVRKILITEHLWESDTSIAVGALIGQGMSTEKIAQHLSMSVKNVQAYMPYERGLYRGEVVSQESVRSERYRARMKQAAGSQVVQRSKKTTDKNISLEEEQQMSEAGKKRENKVNDVVKLHLELDLKRIDENERRILKKYGSMKESISRDILVPADITLHGLNYAILRSFGWQNGHLHKFSLLRETFEQLTENSFMQWSRMAGIYFRFPSEDYDDIYWDDDYEEGQSHKSWLRKKYTGPYKYKGYGEHYLNCQRELKDFISRHDMITVREFSWNMQEQPKPYQVKLSEASIDQVTHSFADMYMEELLERLPLIQILRMPGQEPYDPLLIKGHIWTECCRFDLNEMLDEYDRRRFSSEKKEQEFLSQFDISVLPITDKLLYSYDYGDGWEVAITCTDAYRSDDQGEWIAGTERVDNELNKTLNIVAEKYRPVCVAKDGIELVDDVGGIYGFCDMLSILYESDPMNEEAVMEAQRTKIWANSMGWTGRRVSPEQTL